MPWPSQAETQRRSERKPLRDRERLPDSRPLPESAGNSQSDTPTTARPAPGRESASLPAAPALPALPRQPGTARAPALSRPHRFGSGERLAPRNVAVAAEFGAQPGGDIDVALAAQPGEAVTVGGPGAEADDAYGSHRAIRYHASQAGPAPATPSGTGSDASKPAYPMCYIELARKMHRTPLRTPRPKAPPSEPGGAIAPRPPLARGVRAPCTPGEGPAPSSPAKGGQASRPLGTPVRARPRHPAQRGLPAPLPTPPAPALAPGPRRGASQR